MKVVIIGSGYVGLPTSVGLAELGHHVVCVDRESSKIEILRQHISTIYEDGLEELLRKNVDAGRLSFSTTHEVISEAEVVIIAVGTPPHPVTKEADLKYIHAAAIEIARELKGYTVVAIKSTVPVGTGDSVEYLMKKTNPSAQFHLISLPEFLREGFAVHDFFNPDRIVIGANEEEPKKIINTLYAKLLSRTKVLQVNRRSAELIKYASNAFLAVKIHFINEIADLCAKVSGDINDVATGMGLDSRIGQKFLNPGPGYGGSCFPKDTEALAYMARHNQVELSLVESTIAGNSKRKRKIAAQLISSVSDVPDPKIGVLGLAFKNGTDDCRSSPAVEIIEELLNNDIEIIAYDPLAMSNARCIFGERIKYADGMHDVAEGADLLVVLTECNEFKFLDFEKIIPIIRRQQIVDCRNIVDMDKAAKLGFKTMKIGLNF